MSEIFHRRPLAEEMAAQLLRPGVLDQALRSGLFLSGVRRIGKTTFLKQDLIPALETDGAIVIYVDLWSDTSVSPSVLLQRAVRAKLGNLEDPLSAAFSRQRGTRADSRNRAACRGDFRLHRLEPRDSNTRDLLHRGNG
jgi:hypothetical protein